MTEPYQTSLYTASPRDKRRAFSEAAFKTIGLAAILAATVILIAIIGAITVMGSAAFSRHETPLQIELSSDIIDPTGERDAVTLRTADYRRLIRNALLKHFPDVTERTQILELQALISPGAEFDLVRVVDKDPDLIGRSISLSAALSDDADQYLKHANENSRLSARQIEWISQLKSQGLIESRFNARFLTGGDSSEPELAGVAAGVLGSFLALFIAISIAGPAGVATAVYLEEFAPKNKIADFVEVNINNLAAVPSIVFGLLGLAILINGFGMPRSAPIVGGIVLALMSLPTVIIASRAAIRSIPSNIYEGALAVGASRLQAMMDHVLPASAPGILTGVIIGLAQALGETAPLLMIGMVAFVVTPPMSVFDPSSALPVLIYLWAESPERAFVEKTAGAALVLLFFLGFLNATAIWLRHRFKARGL